MKGLPDDKRDAQRILRRITGIERNLHAYPSSRERGHGWPLDPRFEDRVAVGLGIAGAGRDAVREAWRPRLAPMDCGAPRHLKERPVPPVHVLVDVTVLDMLDVPRLQEQD